MPPVRVSVSSLVVDHGGRRALDEVSLELTSGSATALVGANGSGKTTLLRAIAGLSEPTRGTIDLRSVAGERPRVAMVLQQTTRPAWLPITAHEVVTLGCYARLGWRRRVRRPERDAVLAAARRVQVDDLLDRPLTELSGGQRQRVLVAQALVQDAPILLLDEPVTGLDLPSQQQILRIVDEEVAAGRTVVLSTHHLDEARRCDQVVLLAGTVVAAGAPAEVLTEGPLRRTFGGRVIVPPDGGPVSVLDDHAHGV